MNHYQYAFLDSGSGGLPYLAELRKQSPSASCVYVADTAHFPYGEKKRDEVIAYATETVSRMISLFSPEIIIVACNTISVAALPALRRQFKIPFVGTVPAIKSASLISTTRKIGLWATERTVTDPYTDDLIQQFAPDCEIIRFGDSTLISRIETDLVESDRETRISAVRPAIERFRAAGADTIVLACTHFLNVDEEIRIVAGKDIQIIDSRKGVVQQALRLVSPIPCDSVRGACFVTGLLDAQTQRRYAHHAAHLGIEWGGLL